MKISKVAMESRLDFAKKYFLQHPEATVKELNDEFQKRGEPRMGRKAYSLRLEVIRAAREGKPVAEKPAQKKAQKPVGAINDVTLILGDLARKLAGTTIQKVMLEVGHDGPPVVRYTEVESHERELQLKQ